MPISGSGLHGIFTAMLTLATVAASAQTDTVTSDIITTRVRMTGLGNMRVLDTYLSPERYTGPALHYIEHTTRERKGCRISRQTIHQGSFAYTKNRARNVHELYAMYHFEYAWHYNWLFLGQRLNVKAGGTASIYAGTLYNARNSNNPMQAKAALSVAPSAIASYRFQVCGMPLQARYEASAPLLGLMFSPNYGQSYYEIFSEGNYDHNLIATYPGNAPSLRQMLTLDFRLGNTTFRMGYLGDYQQAKVNNLKYHNYSHALVVGIVKKFKLTHIRP